MAVALAAVSGMLLTADTSPSPMDLSSKFSASSAVAYSTRASYYSVGADGGAGGGVCALLVQSAAAELYPPRFTAIIVARVTSS